MNSAGILVRTDAGPARGTGHSMRCLALAQLCVERGLSVAVAYAEMTSSQLARWEMERCSPIPIAVVPGSVEDADLTARLSRELDCEWVIIDGYQFGSAYQRQLKSHGSRVLCFDDYGHAEHYYADVVLNQNPYAADDTYAARDPITRVLIGSRYAVLRREFVQRAHERRRPVPATASRVLVTLGGSDPRNATKAVIESLRLLEAPLAIRVVVGGSGQSPNRSMHSSAFEEDSLQVIHDAVNVAELMAWAELAIAGAGTTAWELAFMGVPFLALVLADNQVQVADSLERLGIAINLGRPDALQAETLAEVLVRLLADHDARTRMSGAGQRLIDGYGGCRVLQALGLATLRLTKATERDARLIWEWANEPEVRRVSFASGQIPWETHQQWYSRTLSDPGSSIWIAYDAADEPVGQIRFESREGRMYVSVSVAAGRRGTGQARILIEEGLVQAAREFPGRRAHALIKRDNVASIRAFQRAGFTLAGEDTIDGHRAFHYVR